MNRRRTINAVPIASIATWIVIAAFLGTAGIYYVYCKNQLQYTGTTIKRLERQRDDLLTQNEVVRSKIVSLTSRMALQRRVNEGFIKLVPITDDRIVRVGVSVVAAEGDLRAVTNERNVR